MPNSIPALNYIFTESNIRIWKKEIIWSKLSFYRQEQNHMRKHSNYTKEHCLDWGRQSFSVKDQVLLTTYEFLSIFFSFFLYFSLTSLKNSEFFNISFKYKNHTKTAVSQPQPRLIQHSIKNYVCAKDVSHLMLNLFPS